MLSLPLIAPYHSDPTLPSSFRPLPEQPHNAANATNPQHRTRLDEARKLHNLNSPLAILTADENHIATRKHAIRNFGALWIRPPGVPKTLQAMNEEEAERAEQEVLARQEAGLRDLQAQQQLEEAREQAREAGEGAAEQDLDAEIPDADAEEEEDEDDEVEEEGISFNEESMVEGGSQFIEPMVVQRDLVEQQLEEAELTGAAHEEEALGMEHEVNLDDSIPEAGSYQHTDTELEDETSESELQDSFAQTRSATRRSLRGSSRMQAVQPQIQRPPALHDHFRLPLGGAGADALTRSPGSLNLSSSLMENSFAGSSPVLQRGGARGRGRRRGRQS